MILCIECSSVLSLKMMLIENTNLTLNMANETHAFILIAYWNQFLFLNRTLEHILSERDQRDNDVSRQ